MLGKVLAQLVVLLLTMRLLTQLHIALGNNLLQIMPSLLQRLHVKPGVGIGSNVETLNLLVELRQSLEVSFSRR